MRRNYGKSACNLAYQAALLFCFPWLIWWGYPYPEFLAWFGLVMGVVAIGTSIMAAILWVAGE